MIKTPMNSLYIMTTNPQLLYYNLMKNCRVSQKVKTTAVGTIWSYLSSLNLFYSHLINENKEVALTSEEILQTKETVKTWSRNYRNECNR